MQGDIIPQMKKYLFFGLVAGIILAVINTFLLGIPTMPLGTLYLASNYGNCSGESCWSLSIWIGDAIIILISLLISFIHGKAWSWSEGNNSPR